MGNAAKVEFFIPSAIRLEGRMLFVSYANGNWKILSVGTDVGKLARLPGGSVGGDSTRMLVVFKARNLMDSPNSQLLSSSRFVCARVLPFFFARQLREEVPIFDSNDPRFSGARRSRCTSFREIFGDARESRGPGTEGSVAGSRSQVKLNICAT